MVAKRALQRWFPLFLISALGLFLELAVIRWLSAEVRLFSYFKNLPLLAAFLGLAIGFATVRRGHDWQATFAPVFGLFVGTVLLVGRVVSPRVLAYPSRDYEFLWFTADISYWLALGLFLGLVVAFFLLTLLIFIPLGQATGREMARHAPIPAYIVNLLASLAGVWLFAFLSFLQTPPAVWFGLAMLGLGYFWITRGAFSSRTAVIFVAVLALLTFVGSDTIWSPYHRLDISELQDPRLSDGSFVNVGYTLKIQQIFYQSALNLSPQFLAGLEGEIAAMENTAYSYNLPFRVGPQGAQVLVVGAGMGNDVAAALRNGASHVDAVEIDPAILELGRKLHPEHPYDDPRVSPIVDDARSFFEKSNAKYDIVAFGLLDSHTLLSGLSNVRLDSFVYTVESFRQVRSHMEENGLVAVTFGANVPWIDERLGQMLAEVFGSRNVLIYRGGSGTTFVAGIMRPDPKDTRLAAWHPDPAIADLPISTDNWPYLYLRKAAIPPAYWQMLMVIGVVCLAMIARSFPEALHPRWHFWLLGAAFLLIEFKSITELALLFGTTWLVNALAISGVLLMAVVANLVVLRFRRVELRWAYLLLLANLVLSYLFPLELLVGLPPSIRAMASMVLLSLPIFFAGVIFSESLRRAGETAGPLASNLSGSFAGGVLEYGSLLWGIKSLYLIAAVVYAGAFITQEVERD